MTIPFNEEEMRVVSVSASNPRFPEVEEFDYPVTKREAMRAAIDRRPVWLPNRYETQEFSPRVLPDNIARGMVCDGEPFDHATEAGGLDMFGVDWVYEPIAGGSMEKPGQEPLLEDVNDWKELIKFPNVEEWPWEEGALANRDFVDPNRAVQVTILSGWFERLLSFMGFEEAAVALLDEDQEDAIKELMMALSDLYIDIVDHVVKYFPEVDNFLCHDDWGSQAAPFFSKQVAADLFVPAMRRLTDHIHEVGRYAVLHSCGNHGATQIENIIAAGWDWWTPQPMNDIDALWRGYGDQILLSMKMDPFPEGTTEDDMVAIADAWVEKYCTTPGKPISMHYLDKPMLNKTFRKELYRASRKAYSEWPE